MITSQFGFIFVIITGCYGLSSCQPITEKRTKNIDSARLWTGNSFYSTLYELKEAKITKYALGHNGLDRKVLNSKNLTLGELASLWKTFEEEGVNNWMSRYEPIGHDSNSDSNGWGLTIHKDGHVISSAGDNAYPNDANPKKSTSFKMSNRFLRVVNAFETDSSFRAEVK